MFPKHLKAPAQTDFHDAPPSTVPPDDFPSRIPFLTDAASSYAQTEEMAICVWEAPGRRLARGMNGLAHRGLQTAFGRP